MAAPANDIDSRVALALTVGKYLRTVERFETASREFNEACSELRSQLTRPSRFITKVDFKHYLVTSDKEGNFEIEELQVL